MGGGVEGLGSSAAEFSGSCTVDNTRLLRKAFAYALCHVMTASACWAGVGSCDDWLAVTAPLLLAPLLNGGAADVVGTAPRTIAATAGAERSNSANPSGFGRGAECARPWRRESMHGGTPSTHPPPPRRWLGPTSSLGMTKGTRAAADAEWPAIPGKAAALPPLRSCEARSWDSRMRGSNDVRF